MRNLAALIALLLLVLTASGCDQHVEIPGATVTAEAPKSQPAGSPAPLAPAPNVATPADALPNAAHHLTFLELAR